MKVLIVHNRYRALAPSGENAVVDQEAAALTGRGHRVQVFERHSEEIADWSVARRATLPARVLWSSSSRVTLARALAEFRPDVVHIHNTFPLVTPSVLYACRDAAVPVVVTIHNYKLGCANGELFRDGRVCHDCLGGSPLPAVVHGCYRSSPLATLPVVLGTRLHSHAWRTMVSAYMFISQSQRDLLAPLGLPADRSFVKYNFVPSPTDHGSGPTRHQVAYIGRLDRAKGASFMMAAWDAFRTQRPRSGLRLVIAGGGQLTDEVTRWSAAQDSVTMLGHVPRQAVGSILASSRAVIVPSQWEETFGMVAVEAMAVRTAVIASAHGAFPELVTPGRNGTLFPPSDTDALVRVMTDVDDEPGRWDAYGQQGADTYQSRFTLDVGIDRLETIYRYAIEHPSPTTGSPVRATRSRPRSRRPGGPELNLS